MNQDVITAGYPQMTFDLTYLQSKDASRLLQCSSRFLSFTIFK